MFILIKTIQIFLVPIKRLKQVKVLSDPSSILGNQVKVERENQLHIGLYNENLKIKKPEQSL